MSLIPVGYEKDKCGRQVVEYVDTDDMSDEDYAEYCRLRKLHVKSDSLKYYSEIRKLFRKY